MAGLADGALLLDRDLRHVSHNLAIVEILGLRARDLRRIFSGGKSPLEFFGNSDAKKLAGECLEEQRVIRLHEVDFHLPGGDVRTAIITLLPVVDQGEGDTFGVIYTVRDVSAEARMQYQYKQLLAREKARAEELERRVQDRTQELREALEEVTRLARTDPLTGALNRRAFTEFAEQALGLAERYGREFGLLMCDLDLFKRVNDTYGHQVGDVVLSESAEILRRVLRKTDKIARFGGEEFVVLLTETDRHRLLEVGERCRLAVREIAYAALVEGGVGRQTVSIGCACYPEHGTTLDELLTAADQALYFAKERGRDRVELYSRQLAAKPQIDLAAEPCRVVLVHPDEERAEEYRRVLARLYQVVVAPSFARGLDYCRGEAVDIVVAKHESQAASGIDFLHDTLNSQPNAIRVLVTDTEEFSVALRGANEARVDHILLERDGPERLVQATEQVLERRALLRKRFLAEGPGSLRPGPRTGSEDLDEILENRALDFVYQPIVSVPAGATAGYEALCRPQSEAFRSPRLLVDAAMASGKIWDLSRLIREMIAQRLGDLPEDTLIFINLHPAVLDDPEFVTGDSFLLPWASRIVFEITERSGIPDFQRCRESIDRLRRHGFRFAVDDLGSGYASLSSVALLEPDYVKIDLQLVRGIGTSGPRAKLVRGIVEFANEADSKVVAEGVETEEEAEAVAELGCHFAQGYYFARPGPGFSPARRGA